MRSVATVGSVERQIQRIEGFPATIRQLGRNIRDDRTGMPGYPFKRAAPDRINVKAWKRSRFQPRYPGFEVDVIGRDGRVVHGATLLETVRYEYR
jgi:hypothetical protein